VLHDIAVGPFLEQPAGKGPPPLAILGAAHIELHERAGFGNIFPRRGSLTGTQTDNRIADTQRLTGLHRQIAGQAVTLVEQADNGRSLSHRRTGQLI